MKTPKEIFKEFMELEDREDMINYLRSLPKKDDEWPEEEFESEETTSKDFLATALENCQKFNEEFEGTFDK